MSNQVPAALLELERNKRIEAEAKAAEATKVMNLAVARSASIEGVVGKLLDRVRVPDHLAERMKDLDHRDRLDFLMGYSGDWTPKNFDGPAPKSDEEKAKRAAAAMRDMRRGYL